MATPTDRVSQPSLWWSAIAIGSLVSGSPVANGGAASETEPGTPGPVTQLLEVPYTIGDWPENGRGNHRALVHVAEPSEAVYVRLPWRRWDPEDERKGIVVIDETTGQTVTNTVWYNRNREYGDVVFQPVTTPGDYGVYYLPYTQPEHVMATWTGSYGPNVSLADAGWLQRLGLHNPTPAESYLQPYLTDLADMRMALVEKTVEGRRWVGSDLRVVGEPEHFASDHYTMTFQVRFDHPHNTACMPAVLFQEGLWLSAKAYVGKIANREGQLGLSIFRVDGFTWPDYEIQELGELEGELPPFDWQQPGTVSFFVEVQSERTVLRLQYSGTNRGQPFVREITAADTSEERFTNGGPPVILFEPHGYSQGQAVWIEGLTITRNTDRTVLLSMNPSAEKKASPDLTGFPRATLVAMQARNEFNRLYPMGVIATAEETDKLLAAHLGEKILIFPEDRSNPIMMTDRIPAPWALEGPRETLAGTGRPDEYYAFQLGIWAVRADANDVTLQFSDLVGPDGSKIPARALTCYNTTGVDRFGEPFTKQVNVPRGQVQALWNGVLIPRHARGEYTGRIRVRTKDGFHKTIPLVLNVAGTPIENHGDDDPGRLSRLRWLNSKRGQDPTIVPPPFKPVRSSGNRIDVLNRTIIRGAIGLPESIRSNGMEILAGPVTLEAVTATGRMLWKPHRKRITSRNPSSITAEHSAVSDGVQLAVAAQHYFDGIINYDLRLRANQDTPLENVVIKIPVRNDVARFMTGFGYRGNVRTDEALDYRYTEDPTYHKVYPNNHFWLGTVDAGLAVKILPEKDVWDLYSLDLGLYRNWYNQGHGGARVDTSEGTTYVQIFTGPVTLPAGQDYVLRLRLYVTPFKPLRPDRWNRRFTWYTGSQTMADGNICHYHQGSWELPYINYPFFHIDRLRNAYLRHQQNRQDITVYYTLRELSNFAPELLVFKSLGEEVLVRTGALVTNEEGTQVQAGGGGHPWLQEHLGTGYSPGWHVTTATGEVDAAVGTNGNSRLVNYYVEGLAWLKRKVGHVGLYVDQIGFGRETMLRVARILSTGDPDYHLVYHAGEMFSDEHNQSIYWTRASTVVWSLDHIPLVTQLMFGEAFRYDRPAAWWLVELSGLPFGLDNQYYVNPGPERPFREMIFGGATCGGINFKAKLPIRDFWDRWQIMGSKMVGWWDPESPVRTGVNDVLATTYIKQDKTLVVLASWANQAMEVELDLDWPILGLDPHTVRIVAPEIADIQPSREFRVGERIPVEPASGWILSLERKF